jgi:hypothetical protein
MSLSDIGFQQVSFVNSIATTKVRYWYVTVILHIVMDLVLFTPLRYPVVLSVQ